MVPTMILFACWDGADALQQQLGIVPALLPLAGKAMVERAIESAIELGCGRVELVLGDHALAYEPLLGNGERWGCALHYHFLPPAGQSLRLLARLAPLADTLYWIACADSVVTGTSAVGADTLWCEQDQWSGWARLSGTRFAQLAPHAGARASFAAALLAAPGVKHASAGVTLCGAGAGASLATLATILALDGAIPARPRQPGIWIGHGSRVHPDAQLVAPVWIGRHVLVREHALLGPCSMIADDCIIDQGASVERAIVLGGTYVGRGLQVREAIVCGNRVANLALEVVIEIPDRSILDATDRPVAATPWLQRTLAALLWLGGWPLARALRGASAPCAELGGAERGALAVRFAPSHAAVYAGARGAWLRHFGRTFHPGLREVAAGRVNLVGIEPRTPAQVRVLPPYWQRLYRKGRTGLINETLLLGHDGANREMRFAGDALACEPLAAGKLLRLLARYAGALLGDARRPRAAGRRRSKPGR